MDFPLLTVHSPQSSNAYTQLKHFSSAFESALNCVCTVRITALVDHGVNQALRDDTIASGSNIQCITWRSSGYLRKPCNL